MLLLWLYQRMDSLSLLIEVWLKLVGLIVKVMVLSTLYLLAVYEELVVNSTITADRPLVAMLYSLLYLSFYEVSKLTSPYDAIALLSLHVPSSGNIELAVVYEPFGLMNASLDQ